MLRELDLVSTIIKTLFKSFQRNLDFETNFSTKISGERFLRILEGSPDEWDQGKPDTWQTFSSNFSLFTKNFLMLAIKGISKNFYEP